MTRLHYLMLSKLLIILTPQYVRGTQFKSLREKKNKKTEKCNSIVNVAGYITRGGGYGRAEKTNGFTHIQEIESKLKIGLSNIAQNLSQLLWRDLLN